jgi:hypothetical protein
MITLRSVALILTGAVVLGGIDNVSAQTPEHARLSFFEGFWVFTGRLGGVQYGLAGPNTHTESCTLIGAYFVRCQYEVNAPDAAYNGIGIVGFNPGERSFAFTSYDSHGTVTSLRAPADGANWVWAAGTDSRVVWEQLSPTAYAFRVEALQPSGTWRIVDEGRYDKVRPR